MIFALKYFIWSLMNYVDIIHASSICIAWAKNGDQQS
jgi:hypothetical protein